MATVAIAYVGNTNNLKLFGLKADSEGDPLEGQYLDAATVTVTIQDTKGNQVAGMTWPLTMNYVHASNGDYIADLSHVLALQNGKPYVAVIDANASDSDVERWGHWEFPFTAQTRTNA